MKSTTPYSDPNRSFNKNMLKEAGEMELKWLMDIYMGPRPNFSVTNQTVNAKRDALGKYLEVSNSTVANRFKAGENIIVYDPDFPLDHVRAFRTVVDYISSNRIYTKTELSVPGGQWLSIAPELVFRVSSQNCYREDEYGVTRFYSARGGPSEFTDSLGDMFDYEFKFPEYSFTLQNYKDQSGVGFFDPYLTGGATPVNWGGRLVKIYLSAGEEAVKNKLKWEGITHFNAGVSSDNDVLTLNCYHISYPYNQPIGRMKYPDTIEDKEKANKIMETVMGDWTVGFQKLQGKSLPVIPTTLMGYKNEVRAAKTALFYTDSGRELTTVFQSKHTTSTNFNIGNRINVELEFYDFFPSLTPGDVSNFITVTGKSATITGNGSVATLTATDHNFETGDSVYIFGSTNFNGTFQLTKTGANTFTFPHAFNTSISGAQSAKIGNYIITVKLYKGQGTPTGAPGPFTYNSTKFVKWLIENNSVANDLVEVIGESSVPIRDYDTMRFPKNNSYYSTKKIDVIPLTLHGAFNELWAEYQIAGNPLDPDTTDYKIWYCKGNAEEAENWETGNSTINGGNAINPSWLPNIGKVIVRGIPPGTDLSEHKLFVAVKGLERRLTREPNPDCFINLAHNRHFYAQNVSLKATNNKTDSQQLPLDMIRPISGFNQGYGYNGRGITVWLNSKGQRYYQNQYYFQYTEPTEFSYDKDFWMDMEFKVNEVVGNGSYALMSAGNTENLQNFEVLIEDYKLTIYWAGGTKKIVTDFEPQFDPNPSLYCYLLELNYNSATGYIDVLVWTPDKSYRYEVNYIERDEFEEGDEFECSIWQFTHAYPFENITVRTTPELPGISTVQFSNKDLKAYIGVVRVVNGRYLYDDPEVSTTVVGDDKYDEQFVDYNSATYADDPISIAKTLLQRSGVPDNRFDETWDQYSKDRRVYAYNSRLYIQENGAKALDEACKLLGQIGFILKMRPVGDKLKFTLINDNIDGYQSNVFNDMITDYDIEEGSFSIDREVNQYFNICYAKYNYLPSLDEIAEESKAYKEVNAYKKDAGLNHWYQLVKEDDFKPCFEFPNLYQYNDVEERLKNTLRIATPNPEMITCVLTWKHILLECGQFVRMTYGRYKNAPMMVREVTIDETASRVTVKLMSLEQIKFYDEVTKELHTPTGGTSTWIAVGGIDANIEAIEDTPI